jgi:hypothetical protein
MLRCIKLVRRPTFCEPVAVLPHKIRNSSRFTGSTPSDSRQVLRNVECSISLTADGRQLEVPVVLPQEEMLLENFVCFGPKSDVDRNEILSSVSTSLQDTYPGW